MSQLSIASQLAAIEKQKDLLAKNEADIKAESHGKVFIQIIKMVKYAVLTLSEITAAYYDHKTKQVAKVIIKPSKASSTMPRTMKGLKLPPKYRNQLSQIRLGHAVGLV